MRIFYFIFILFLSLGLYSQNKERNDVQAVLKKVVPRFKASGDIKKVFDALREETIQSDPGSPVLSLVYFPPSEGIDGFGIDEEKPEQKRSISVDFENLTVREIINNICFVYNLRYKSEKNTVIILHPSDETENLKVKFFKLALSDIKKLGNGGAQTFLESQGVIFNTNCFAKYLSSVNTVAIKNNETELKKAEKCFDLFRINGLLSEIKNTLTEKKLKQHKLLKQIKQIDDLINDEYDEQLSQEEKEIKLNRKLNIVIPKVRFVDRKLAFIADFLKRTSRDLDEEGEGLNILFKADLINLEKTVNLDLDDVTIQNVIQFICRKLELSYKVEERTVIIGRALQGVDVTKSYDTSDTFMKYVKEEHKNDFKKALLFLGVKFKPGSSLDYIKNIQRIVISNSSLEHRKLYDVFQFFNK